MGSSTGDFGDMHNCKDNIKSDFVKFDMMCPSASVRPRVGHGLKMRSTQFQST